MPVLNRIGEFSDDMKTRRRYLHENPELQYDCVNTAAFVAEKLEEFGVDELHSGIAKTGIVAIINGKGAGPTIGLRADMDALPIVEETGLDHASKIPGKMHACGHDGHTTMLLGAARYLCETRNFTGRVALIFQPAEEGERGALAMVEAGIMDDFDIKQVFALHNLPNAPTGHFMMREGAFLAAADGFEIVVQGRGGHAAMPQETLDPIPVAANIYAAIQTISSRNLHARDNTVISVTMLNAGTAFNIVPDTAFLAGTFRTLDKSSRDVVVRRLKEICDFTGRAFGCEVRYHAKAAGPATVNHREQTAFAARVAQGVSGAEKVNAEAEPIMGSEDFSYMLEARPGAYVFLGAGEGADLHHPKYDFNDEISPIGASYFVKLVEEAQPLKS